jgi:hypothetical protein
MLQTKKDSDTRPEIWVLNFSATLNNKQKINYYYSRFQLQLRVCCSAALVIIRDCVPDFWRGDRVQPRAAAARERQCENACARRRGAKGAHGARKPTMLVVVAAAATVGVLVVVVVSVGSARRVWGQMVQMRVISSDCG